MAGPRNRFELFCDRYNHTMGLIRTIAAIGALVFVGLRMKPVIIIQELEVVKKDTKEHRDGYTDKGNRFGRDKDGKEPGGPRVADPSGPRSKPDRNAGEPHGPIKESEQKFKDKDGGNSK